MLCKLTMMTDLITPTRAYDLLDAFEKQMVDDYVKFAVSEQNRKRERIFHALYLPIPSEYIKRSQDALYKPLLRAAIGERLREEADSQDISPSRVIREHASIAFSNISDYIEPHGFGEYKLRDLTLVSPDKMRAVKSIETKPGAFGLHMKITLHDKHPSLKTMTELMGLVAPDKPAPLDEYVKPVQKVDQKALMAPEKEYTELLQSVGG